LPTTVCGTGFLTGQMPYLSPNQQRQSTERKQLFVCLYNINLQVKA